MSIANPKDDGTTIVNRTSPSVGDLVQRAMDGMNGRVLEINFGSPTTVYVRWDDRSMSKADLLNLRRV
jgi:hypothetical protein